ncbi:MAG: serine/threonine protein kinase [Clostridia bacterium]|nr:serine/threonine protein kinase [Clostridia bacterium]
MTKITQKTLCPYCLNVIQNTCKACGKKFRQADFPTHRLAPFTLLKNRYLTGVALGEGGFGITYRGLDQLTGRQVAIKEYYPSALVTRDGAKLLPRSEDFRSKFTLGKQRFASEAKKMAVVKGKKGITAVYDFFSENDTAYIVMEYLPGVTLEKYLSVVGRLTFTEAVALLREVIEGLQTLHEAGFVHADVSPDNIMVMPDGSAKLLDFGSASVADVFGGERRVTLKKHYAPCEQYNSGRVLSRQTDVYAIGVTIYYALTLTLPPESVKRAERDEIKLPSALGGKITPLQESALMTALCVDEKKRYHSARDMLTAFECDNAMPKTLKKGIYKKLFGENS